jgi:exodeoxyribonuclease-3
LRRTLKLVTWNVNGLRSAYRQGLRAYLEQEQPDVLCLQEIRVDPGELDASMQPPPEYRQYFAPASSRKGYSGVAIMTRLQPDTVRVGIGIERFDREGRLIAADFGAVTIASVYCPKGYSPDDARHAPEKVERLRFKLDFYQALGRFVQQLHAQGRRVILSGDFNTAHTELDLARPRENERTSGFLPEERAAFDELLAMGLVDVFRRIVPEGGHYTWWSQRRGARERNIGWRIDYHLLDEALVSYVRAAYLQPQVRGSDHCPAVVELDRRAFE